MSLEHVPRQLPLLIGGESRTSPARKGNMHQDLFWRFLPDSSHTQTRFPHFLLLWSVSSLDEQCAGTRSRGGRPDVSGLDDCPLERCGTQEAPAGRESGVHEGAGACAAVLGISQDLEVLRAF